jgi:hypothetical protein
MRATFAQFFAVAVALAGVSDVADAQSGPALAGNVDCDGHAIGAVSVQCKVAYASVTANEFSNIYTPDPVAFPKAAHPVAILVHGYHAFSGGDLQAYTLANDGFLTFQAEYDTLDEGPGNVDLFQGFHEMQLLVRWIHEFATTYHADASHIVLIGGSAGGAVATHVANYTGIIANTADPLYCANGLYGNDVSVCEAVDGIDYHYSSAVQAVVDEYGEGPGAMDPTDFGTGANVAMSATYPPLLGVYPDDSRSCSTSGGYEPVRKTLGLYQTATGLTPPNYTYVGNHAMCPLPSIWLPNNEVPTCSPTGPLPLYAATVARVDASHGQNINTIIPAAVAKAAVYPFQWTDTGTVFHCVVDNWIVSLPGFQP